MLKSNAALKFFRKTVILFLVFWINYDSVSAQKYTNFDADFSLKEKKSSSEVSNLMIGSLRYVNTENKITYNIKFPEIETWIMQDSFFTIFHKDTIVEKRKLASLNEYLMFKNIMDQKSNDFGLTDLGFTVLKVEELEEGLMQVWEPPAQFKTFMKFIITVIKENLLQSVIVTDIDDEEINKTFYEDYKIINDIPVPCKIISHYKTTKEEVFKALTFRNVKIN